MSPLLDALNPLAVVAAAVLGPAVPVYLSRRRTRGQLDKVVGQVETVQRVVNGERTAALERIVVLERENASLHRQVELMTQGGRRPTWRRPPATDSVQPVAAVVPPVDS